MNRPLLGYSRASELPVHFIQASALLLVLGATPTAATAAGSGSAAETFCYEKITDASNGRSTVYFTNLFLIPRDEAVPILVKLGERMKREVAQLSPGSRMVAAKPVCSFIRTESAAQDLEETIGYFRRDPTVTIATLTWERFPK